MKRVVLVAVAVVAVALAGAGCSRSEARPSGVTERWLQAVSEQGRAGLREEGAKRAAELAEPGATAKVKPPDAEDGRRTFSDLEVGKAAVDVDQARVPFRITARIQGGAKRERSAVAVLVKHGHTWKVVDVVPRLEEEKVPSEGGARPATANLGHWLLFAGLGLVLTAASIALIDRQPTSTTNAGTS